MSHPGKEEERRGRRILCGRVWPGAGVRGRMRGPVAFHMSAQARE